MDPTNSFPEFLTVTEVAQILRLKRSTAYEYIKIGIIPSIKIGRFIRVRADFIHEMGCIKNK
jgi:excisionase family DNA binding protein